MDASSPLEAEIRRSIARVGPMSVAQYMELCLFHPEHGYYLTQEPIGRAGDFTTAPEISQMFGELIGLWAAAVWRQMDEPGTLRLIELGPGRGTLMADALRALEVAPAFRAVIDVNLVEISPLLRQGQQELLATLNMPVFWHKTLQEVPEGPAIVIANEFFDALPVHQVVKQADGWHERVVALDDADQFAFALADNVIPHFGQTLPQRVREAPIGAIYEWRSNAIALDLAHRAVHGPAAVLVIDYGHTESAPGDTLQAVRAHNFANPLRAPGRVDLTAHVDFQALAETADSIGAAVHGPIAQGEFLRRLGIDVRAKALKARAKRETAADIDVALARLTGGGRKGMGELFKTIAIADPRLGSLPGFEP